MSDSVISLEHALALRDRGALLVDARSPAEYAEATIPGAINVPILDDAEREEIGTLYKQISKQAARRRGVELVAPKIPALVAQVEAARPAGSPPAVVFCWRGGMRSRALTQFLELAGVPARQMAGGHKAFRGLVRDFFEQGRWGRLIVLRGLTGVGKTALLQRLAGEGYPVIDLEGLANHRGSAFGHLGLPRQPTQRMFEALLWDALRHVAPEGYALAEGESRHIGRLILPLRVYQALQVETSLWVEAPLATRVRNILADYPARDDLRDGFARPLRALKERLGRQAVDELTDLLQAGAWEELVKRLMISYYDPLYRHTLPQRRIEVPGGDDAAGLAAVKAAIGRVLAQGPAVRA
ncbi:MAG: tRNA 2-selenouridine(34) synthase MnmH [Deltaproteobacteria bacterium]|nr:MAG: tRNA 2-selenouridine(34) synthase MnmH [Deltaproteobacteria bacterium]